MKTFVSIRALAKETYPPLPHNKLFFNYLFLLHQVALAAVLAAASAAPADYAVAAAAPLAYAGVPAASAVGYAAPAVAASVPAPYTTAQVAGAPVETVHQPAPIVRKQVHFGQTQFVSGYASRIHKPAIPELPIAVPTALKGSVSYNAPIVKAVKEPFVVNEPYAVERKVQVPYDVPVVKEQLVEVPVPVHVDAPYEVPHPVAVQGEPIVNVRQGPAQVIRTHEARVAQPVVAAAPVAAYAAAPAAVAAAPVAAYAGAPAAAYGYGLNAYGLNGAYGYAAAAYPGAVAADAAVIA